MELSFRPFLLTAILLLGACGGGGGDNASSDSSFCADLDTRQRLFALMNDYYLWYEKLPTLDLSNNRYCSLANLLDDLRYKAEDRFSYLQLKTVADSFFNNGTYQGFGFGYQLDKSKSASPIVAFVYTDSAAGSAGMQRGDRVLSLNGTDTANLSSSAFSNLLTTAANGGSASMQLQAPGQAARSVSMATGIVKVNTVLDARVVDHNGLKIGYMAFKSFIRPSEQELDSAFAGFQAAAIDELVVDLRYNGGGLINVSAMLASLAAGQVVDGSVFTTFNHNNKHTSLDKSHLFQKRAASLTHLTRVVVLSLPGTCSASELFINGLRPWLGNGAIVSIGDTTCGKPFGSYLFTLPATATDERTAEYSVSALTFRTVNSLGQGDYVGGMPANCAATDDLDRGFGDASEGMLQAALAYIGSGTCNAVVPRGANERPDFPQPYRINDGY